MLAAGGSPRVPASFRSRLQRGYTLMEVLLAVGIFAIGFAMVATIFPAALLLQKKTVDAINGKQMARNAEAVVTGRGMTQTAVLNAFITDPRIGTIPWDTNETVVWIPEDLIAPPVDTTKPQWTLRDRSFPTTLSNTDERTFYWVPMIKDADSGPGSYSFTVYLFVLQRHADIYDKSNGFWVNYRDPNDIPGVVGIGAPNLSLDATDQTRINFPNQDHDLNGTNDAGRSSEELLVFPGSKVLDNNGTIYDVILADAGGINVSGLVTPNPNAVTTIWFGYPGIDSGGDPETENPTVDIIPIVDPFTP
jgi:prepilin-type N-terminal cleavage/methylation domain-containing protein